MIGAVFFAAGRDTGGDPEPHGLFVLHPAVPDAHEPVQLAAVEEDRALFLREKAAGAYDTASYFVAVVVFDVLALRVLPPLFFALVAYPAIGLHGFSANTESALNRYEASFQATDGEVFTRVRCVCTIALVLVLANVAAERAVHVRRHRRP